MILNLSSTFRSPWILLLLLLIDQPVLGQTENLKKGHISFVPRVSLPFSNEDYQNPVWEAGFGYSLPHIANSWQNTLLVGVLGTSNNSRIRSQPGIFTEFRSQLPSEKQLRLGMRLRYQWVKFNRTWLAVNPNQGNATELSYDRSIIHRFEIGPDVSYTLNPAGYPKFNVISGLGWTHSRRSSEFRDFENEYSKFKTSGYVSIYLGLMISYRR